MTHKEETTKKTKNGNAVSVNSAITDTTIVSDVSKTSIYGNTYILWLKRHKLLTLLALLWLGLAVSVALAFVFKENNTNEQLSETEQYANTLNSITNKGVSSSATFEEKSDYYNKVLAYSNLAANPKTAMSIYKNEVAGRGYNVDPYSLEWLSEEYIKTVDVATAQNALRDAVILLEKNKYASEDAAEINAYQQKLQERLNEIQ